MIVTCVTCGAEVEIAYGVGVWLAVCPLCGGRCFKWDDHVVVRNRAGRVTAVER